MRDSQPRALDPDERTGSAARVASLLQLPLRQLSIYRTSPLPRPIHGSWPTGFQVGFLFEVARTAGQVWEHSVFVEVSRSAYVGRGIELLSQADAWQL
jgi:hypothetical protein